MHSATTSPRTGRGQKLQGINWFSGSQLTFLIAISVMLWFAAASAVRIGSPLGMFGPTASIASFAAGIPIAWISVVLIVKMLKLLPGQIVPAISLGLGLATCLDGLAITWLGSLYGSELAQITLGAAWILWGVFTFTAAAFFEAYRQSQIQIQALQ
jgi:hypothetical protein